MKEKNDNQTGFVDNRTEASRPPLNLDGWNPFPVEFITFSEQLFAMHSFFSDAYSCARFSFCSETDSILNNLSLKVVEVAEDIGKLAGFEFLQSCFWNENKQSVIEKSLTR